MNLVKELINNNKTFGLCLVIILVSVIQWLDIIEVPTEVWTALFAAVVYFLRIGVRKTEAKAVDLQSPISNPKS